MSGSTFAKFRCRQIEIIIFCSLYYSYVCVYAHLALSFSIFYEQSLSLSFILYTGYILIYTMLKAVLPLISRSRLFAPLREFSMFNTLYYQYIWRTCQKPDSFTSFNARRRRRPTILLCTRQMINRTDGFFLFSTQNN